MDSDPPTPAWYALIVNAQSVYAGMVGAVVRAIRSQEIDPAYTGPAWAIVQIEGEDVAFVVDEELAAWAF